MPDEVIKEWDAIKAKIGAAIEELKAFSLRDSKLSLSSLVEKIVESYEVARQTSHNLLTDHPHWSQKSESVVSTRFKDCSSSDGMKDLLEHPIEHLKGIQVSEPISVDQKQIKESQGVLENKMESVDANLKAL
ncbi:hypothetical protein A2U01_0020885, partial [Trifolium medium]|nr:hypothetical protein [Trifolium medium]